MVRTVGEARAQDTNNLHYKIPNYIPLEYQMKSVTLPITRGEKSGCGFSHPATTKLLCPLRYLDRLQADPMYVCAYIYLNQKFLTPSLTSLFKNEVENGMLKLCASDKRNWPSFLYPWNMPYNELELDKGLFWGHVFIWVCSLALAYIFSFPGDIFKSLHTIFTGKSSAFTGYWSALK